MRRRDLGILILSALSILYSLQKEGSFSFREAWFHAYDEDYPIKHEAERLPPPIVADLNGDGRPEVIVATHDAKLQVLNPRFKSLDDGFREADVITEVSLLPERVRVAAGRRPVAMAAGTVQRTYFDGRSSRKQVLVVVTDGWIIMCFDHNLKKLWESTVQDDFPHGSYHKEVSITITNHTINHGDVGLVIVGGSVERQPQLYLDPFEQELISEKEAERHRHSADANETNEDVNAGKAHRFTYYAFAGMTGTLRWSHKSEDFRRDHSSSEETIPQHNYKLDASAFEKRYHPEAGCKEFRESILGILPHRWQSRDDTRFQLAHFRKHVRSQVKKLPGSKAGKSPPDGNLAPGKDPKNKVAQVLGKTAEYAASGKPKKKYNYMSVITNRTSSLDQPNVVVAHLKEGIEAVHLASGKSVCKLWLQEGGLHADINGDGVIDHVQAIGGERVVPGGSMEALRPCTAIATSGVPVREQLFNGTICRRSGMDSFLLQQGEFGSRAFGRNLDTAPIETVPPILFPLQQGLKRSRGLVVFLTNRGEVTAYDHDGEQAWQVSTSAIWMPRGHTGGGGGAYSGGGLGHSAATLDAVAMRRGGPLEGLLVGGERAAVLLSPRGGHVAMLPLPAAPLRPLVVADFSGDGLNDVVAVTSDGIYGFVQTQQPAALLFTSLLACLLLILCAVFLLQHFHKPQPQPKHRRVHS